MIKVLVVDDSVVFRTQISSALSKCPQIQVVGTAANGSIALQKLKQLSVDVMTLDMEMPGMSGIDVLKEIRQASIPVHVIIFSSQTQRGAEAAISALEAGADDIVAKPSGEGLTLETAGKAIEEALIPKVLQFNSESANMDFEFDRKNSEPLPNVAKRISPKQDLTQFSPKVLVIGSSTGGPAALEKIFQHITAPLNIPVMIVQHMPPVFTGVLAKRLSEICGVPASEATSGEVLKSNHIYVAPGDYHMVCEKVGSEIRVVIHQKPQRNSVRPAVDYLFESASELFNNTCLGIVLTGMGEDGLIGAKAIRERGGAVAIQDKESSVVFGMPGAIFQADEYDQIGNLEIIASIVRRVTKG